MCPFVPTDTYLSPQAIVENMGHAEQVEGRSNPPEEGSAPATSSGRQEREIVEQNLVESKKKADTEGAPVPAEFDSSNGHGVAPDPPIDDPSSVLFQRRDAVGEGIPVSPGKDSPEGQAPPTPDLPKCEAVNSASTPTDESSSDTMSSPADSLPSRAEEMQQTIILSPEISLDDIIIMFMGATGTGKSTFIDLLVGQEGYRSGDDLASVTSEVEAIRIKHPKYHNPIVLVDTPGFDDTYLTEAALLKKVANWLEKTYREKVKLSGVVYLHSIAERRMGKSSVKNLNIFDRLCGENAMKRVMLVTTMWENVKPDQGNERQTQLEKQFWQPMIEKGAKAGYLKSTDRAEAWRIVHELITTHVPTAMVLQEELVDQGMKLGRTGAGKVVRRAMEEHLSDLNGQLKRLQKRKNSTDDPKRMELLQRQIQEIEKERDQNTSDLRGMGGSRSLWRPSTWLSGDS